jgi:sugar phosphate isomerase/epimerase
VGKRQFGVSTHLYNTQRLRRDHLLEIAAHGFEAVEVFAARAHFDYHNAASVAELQQWLAEAGLELARVHAPVGESAPTETEQALYIARRIPVKVFVLHLEGSRDQSRRMVERLAELAAPLGVTIAVEVVSNPLSRPGSLVHFIEDDLTLAEIAGAVPGICLDLGHAHIDGDLVDAMELVSEHLVAIDVHDNRGRHDDHLVPFEGTIDWPLALTTMQKIGYEETLMFEIRARGSARETLQRASRARERFEKLLCTSI